MSWVQIPNVHQRFLPLKILGVQYYELLNGEGKHREEIGMSNNQKFEDRRHVHERSHAFHHNGPHHWSQGPRTSSRSLTSSRMTRSIVPSACQLPPSSAERCAQTRSADSQLGPTCTDEWRAQIVSCLARSSLGNASRPLEQSLGSTYALCRSRTWWGALKYRNYCK